MGLSRNHYVHLANGRFSSTTQADMDGAFRQFQESNSPSGWLIHFGSGLMSHEAAVKSADVLLRKYESAGAYPYFFIWESHEWQTVSNNLSAIAQEGFFQKVVAKLIGFLIPRLAPEGISGIAGLNSAEAVQSDAAVANVICWFHDGGARIGYDDITSDALPQAGLTSFNSAEIEAYLTTDADFRQTLAELRISSSKEAEVSDAKARRFISAAVYKELFGEGEEKPDQETVIHSLAPIIWCIARRVTHRFADKRDHGLYTTVVEEVLRVFYADKIGSTFFWNQLKKDAANAFIDEDVTCGGAAFLARMKAMFEAVEGGPKPFRSTLIGHGAGAIYVALFLLAADDIFPKEITFDVVLLAPAIDFGLFRDAVQTGRVREIRQFGLSDELESNDSLLKGVSPALTAIYPRSLLYFVSGLLETEVDQPLLGMQRYYTGDQYTGESFSSVMAGRAYFGSGNRIIWSVADKGEGRRSTSRSHDDFDIEDSPTLESLLYIVREGLQADANEQQTHEIEKRSFSSFDSERSPSRAISHACRPSSTKFDRHDTYRALDSLSDENLSVMCDHLPDKTRLTAGSIGKEDQINVLMKHAEDAKSGYRELFFRANRIQPQTMILQNLAPGAVDRVDRRFEQKFQAIQQTPPDSNAESVAHEDSMDRLRLPMLILVNDENATLDDVSDLEVVTRIGTIIAAKGSEASLRQLQKHSKVVSVEQSGPGEGYDCIRSMKMVNVTNGTVARKFNEQGDQALIGIIDGGIDVLHGAFRGADNKTRIIALWDLTDPNGPPPANFKQIGGTLHTEDDINRYISNRQVEKYLGRDQEIGHGTHVASIAAGTPDPLGSFPGGVAPQSKLVVVVTGRGTQYEENSPQSLGYSVTHAAALKFIDEVAQSVGLPVVVNVSQGKNSGSHDGMSLLETAFDFFSRNGREPGRIIVKSAGNDRQSNGHAFLSIGNQGFDHLDWSSSTPASPYHRRRDAIELWFESTFEMTFELANPSAELSPKTNWLNPTLSGVFKTGNRYSINYTRRHKDNGQSLLSIEITNGSFRAIEAGKWLLRITAGAQSENVEVDAWIDRTDTRPIMFVNHLTEDRTLSVPGTAISVIAVGAVESTAPPVVVGDFSAYGDTRDKREKPEIVAPGVDIVAAKSDTDFGLKQDSGTSMAAPHVTGAIALSLSAHVKGQYRIPNANQMRTALVDSASHRNAQWNRGSGHGVLNVEALLQLTPFT